MPVYLKWQCPHCGRGATIRDEDYSSARHEFSISNVEGPRILISEFFVCPNIECNRFQLVASMYESRPTFHPTYGSGVVEGNLIAKWTLIPPPKAKPFPSYIPNQIITDYREACLIAELSPKASATLSRRCLQGIIRDFWKVSKGKLEDEILAIKDKCDKLTWEAIDATRKIGNIGAHMQKDINFIIDVDPGEAGLLIALIEILLKDWYIEKHDKEENLKKISEISQKKDEQKKAAG